MHKLYPIRQNPILSGCCVPTGTETVSSLSPSNFCFPSHFWTIEYVAALPLLWNELLHQKQCCRECGSVGPQTVVLTEADGESKSISRMRSCSSGMMPRMNLCLFHYNQAAVIWLACLPGNSATLGLVGVSAGRLTAALSSSALVRGRSYYWTNSVVAGQRNWPASTYHVILPALLLTGSLRWMSFVGVYRRHKHLQSLPILGGSSTCLSSNPPCPLLPRPLSSSHPWVIAQESE